MSLEGLKVYGEDYGHSSDDGGPDELPNSGADNDATNEGGQVRKMNLNAAQRNEGFHHSVRQSMEMILTVLPCTLQHRNPNGPNHLFHQEAEKIMKFRHPIRNPATETNYFLILDGDASADSSMFTLSGKR